MNYPPTPDLGTLEILSSDLNLLPRLPNLPLTILYHPTLTPMLSVYL